MVLFEFANISEYIESTKVFVVNVRDIIYTAFSFLPSPLDEIAIGSIFIFMALLIISIIRG